MKPWHMQLLMLSSASLFLLREIYLVRISTSEFGSILHLISVDPILKFEFASIKMVSKMQIST